MAGNGIESGRSVTSKISSILLMFSEGTEYSLSEIARITRLPISTTHRLVVELTYRHLLERTDAGLYRAGLPLRTIAACDAGAPDIADRAPSVLEDLAAVTGRRVRLGVLRESKVLYIEKHPGQHPTSSFAAAASLPAHATAMGRVLLAFSPPEVINLTIRNGLRRYTRHTMTAPDELRRALAVTRLTRISVIRRELESANSCIAMPVFGPGGKVVAAVELAVDDLRDFQPVMASLTIATRSLSRELQDKPSNSGWAHEPNLVLAGK